MQRRSTKCLTQSIRLTSGCPGRSSGTTSTRTTPRCWHPLRSCWMTSKAESQSLWLRPHSSLLDRGKTSASSTTGLPASSKRSPHVKLTERFSTSPARSCHRRSEEHTSELQSLMRISYAVFFLTQKTHKLHTQIPHTNPSL